MLKTKDGSTGRLIQLCIGYFIFYVITGVSVKYFLGKPELGYPGMSDLEYLVYSTIGGNLICLLVAILSGWHKFKSDNIVKILGYNIPVELLFIIPSGFCTAVVIPTTTLMYTLPISVMVAMVIMRGAIIVVSRIIDSVLIAQGILKKEVFWEENVAVIFAIIAISVKLFFSNTSGGFDFVKSPAAVAILSSYILAYTVRIYIMNYYKNTRTEKGSQMNNKTFFAIEQIAASVFMLIAGVVFFFAPQLFGSTLPQIDAFRSAIVSAKPVWPLAIISGVAFGIVAFFSVFLFMFKGRTATFAGLVNRLTSLIAGTAATLVSYLIFSGKLPSLEDWFSLGLIFVAVGFLSRSEKRRIKA